MNIRTAKIYDFFHYYYRKHQKNPPSFWEWTKMPEKNNTENMVPEPFKYWVLQNGKMVPADEKGDPKK